MMFTEPYDLTFQQMQVLSDEELMAHAQAGRHDALAVIISRYQRLVWDVAAKIVHDSGAPRPRILPLMQGSVSP